MLPTVHTPKDHAVLLARVQHLLITRIERKGPDGQSVIRDVHPFPALPVIRAAVRTVLRPDEHDLRIFGVRRNRPDRRRVGKAAHHELPAVTTDGHAIEPGSDGTVWRG